MFWKTPEGLPTIADDLGKMLLGESPPNNWDRTRQALPKALDRASSAELDRAVASMVDTLSRVEAARVGMAALLAGAMVEHGADATRAGAAIAARIPTISEAIAQGDTSLVDSLRRLCTAEMACLSRSKALRADVRQQGRLASLSKLKDEVDEAAILGNLLAVLDDEQIVVFHPDPGQGFVVRISGIVDNFQLHTLVCSAVVRPGEPGWVQARPPDKTEVWAAHGGPEVFRACNTERARAIHGTGLFNLVAWDGTWIWGEGKPADIPMFDGVRIVRLESLPYQRSWGGLPYFPAMEADAVVVRALASDEVADLARKLQPPLSSSEAVGKSPRSR
jgi:hypothetical protein